jgi:hypothetical protein
MYMFNATRGNQMKVISRESVSMTTEGVQVQHDGKVYYVLLRGSNPEVVKPDGLTQPRNTKLAKALLHFARYGECCGAVVPCSTCPRKDA